EIVDLWAYFEAGFHNLVVASVKERYEKEAIKTALWILGEGQLSLTKCVILVGPDVNPRDFKSVLRSLGSNFEPSKDFILVPGTSQDTLDFTGPKINLGSKMILDATGGGSNRNSSLSIDLHDLQKLDGRILEGSLLENTFLVLKVKSEGRKVLEKVGTAPKLKGLKMIAAVSPDVPLDNLTLLIWGIFTRFDCERDTFFPSVKLEGGHPVYDGPLLIDATMKPGYPEPLKMTEAVVKRVDERWREYGFR
ncbi:MAG: UbiD family decarboxylase, partial [Elusimicrobia bacterium]|nr:UbiD family decarboxylase [Candidatus Obscuribacterium magneticum]